jgi:hypothetical protein
VIDSEDGRKQEKENRRERNRLATCCETREKWRQLILAHRRSFNYFEVFYFLILQLVVSGLLACARRYYSLLIHDMGLFQYFESFRLHWKKYNTTLYDIKNFVIE